MYLHLGNETLVNTKNIVGIFDLEKTSVKNDVKSFLKKATEENKIVNVSYDMPKSFVVCQENNNEMVYVSALSVNTLMKRIKVGEVF